MIESSNLLIGGGVNYSDEEKIVGTYKSKNVYQIMIEFKIPNPIPKVWTDIYDLTKYNIDRILDYHYLIQASNIFVSNGIQAANINMILAYRNNYISYHLYDKTISNYDNYICYITYLKKEG